MAYQYSNPYASAAPQSASARSTFGATQAASAHKFQVLLTGLPPDVGEQDLRETICQAPLSFPASTTTVKCFYSADGVSLGTALIAVGNEIDAERLRREYSGQLIDNTYRIFVHHVLAPTQVLPSKTATALAGASSGPSLSQTRAGATKVPTGPAAKQTAKAAPAKVDGKAPGLKLLARLNKPGSKEQAALLARQKDNLKKTGSKDLLARMAGAKPSPAGAKAKAKGAQTAKSNAADKVARAKARTNKDSMDVDAPLNGDGAKGKSQKEKPKSQAELDAEMVLWERQRRFAQA